ncbi:hypothetical protein BVC80_8315g3 [Macleaya cordata]|uniref:Zinc finger protein n=1 Tax=Macleaya cordata TaxID=56857 RepID=A0A200QUM0_MACCD|nr:hypothetical protein BVC80_8315g3 [Macleaya cordata]
MWKINGFPYKHAVACIIGTGQDVYKFCEKFFFIESFRSSYSVPIELVIMDERFDEVPDDPQIVPPIAKPGPGRPRKKRIESSRAKPKKQQKCGRCKKFGTHNLKTCKETI